MIIKKNKRYKEMRTYQDWIREHPDYEWVNKKIDGHGGSHCVDKNMRMIIGYIGNRNRIQVFGLNIILYFKWIARKLKRSDAV